MFNGPAHNNLGVLFLERGQLCKAANEFEWTRKLLPGHPDPRVNLALTLERAGSLAAQSTRTTRPSRCITATYLRFRAARVFGCSLDELLR